MPALASSNLCDTANNHKDFASLEWSSRANKIKSVLEKTSCDAKSTFHHGHPIKTLQFTEFPLRQLWPKLGYQLNLIYGLSHCCSLLICEDSA